MPTEADLRAWFSGEGGQNIPGRALDPDTIIRRTRRRRLPKQLALGGTVTLAVAGIGVASVAGIRSLTAGSGASTVMSADRPAAPTEGDGIASGGIQQAPAYKLNLCGGTLVDAAPRSTGLVLTAKFPATAPAGSSRVDGTVTLTNTGTERATGTTAASPTITLSQNGLVLWHSNGPMIMLAVLVDLAPGQSMDYSASFVPVKCEVEDDSAGSFRDGLPPLPPGDYQVSAAIDFVPDGAGAGVPPEQLIGPVTPITLG